MKVLLRNARIGLYYAGPKHWVGRPDAAVDLQTMELATQVSRDEDFDQMEILVDYGDPTCELVLPLRARKASRTSGVLEEA